MRNVIVSPKSVDIRIRKKRELTIGWDTYQYGDRLTWDDSLDN